MKINKPSLVWLFIFTLLRNLIRRRGDWIPVAGLLISVWRSADVDRYFESTAEGQLNVAVETGRREVERAGTQIDADRRAVTLAVDVEEELASSEVDQNADRRADSDSAVGAVRVLPAVHHPTAAAVDVHAPSFEVFTCRVL